MAPHGTAFAKRRHIARTALWAAHREPRAVQRWPHMFACTRESTGEAVCALRESRDHYRTPVHASAPATATACARDAGSSGDGAMIAEDPPPKQASIYPAHIAQTPLPLTYKIPGCQPGLLHSYKGPRGVPRPNLRIVSFFCFGPYLSQ